MLSNYVISGIRTYVPILIGLGLTWLASTLKIVIDPSSQAGLVALCTTVLTAGYWLIARLLERWQPKLGFLLGVPQQPVYTAKTVADLDPVIEPPVNLIEGA